MADVRLHGLFRQEEPFSDLAVDQPVGDELEDLDLARRRLLLELTQDRRRRERDHRSGALRVPTCRSSLEPAAVVAVSVQDLSTLRGVHAMRIGGAGIAL
jgi:hypothetical protein